MEEKKEEIKKPSKVDSDKLFDLSDEETVELKLTRNGPDHFDIITGELDTKCRCPKCGYEW